jgi:ferric-dicitrate binding protein FerR (iron transport regulator)
MKNNYNDIDHKTGETEGFFRELEVPYSKSREEAWAAIEEKMTEKPFAKIIVFRSRKLIFAVAASFALLAGVFSVLRLYTTQVYCPDGQHLSHSLPDGSKVEMNADSKISYKPLWWRFSREVRFEGEGYFEVEKGDAFTVSSTAGSTEVLGTSFNIYSRNSEYKVTCLTGKVKVTSFSMAEVVLTPEYSASVNSAGAIVMTKELKAADVHSWTINMFTFTSRPLDLVLKEISRQYNIRITMKSPADYIYTGHFSRNRPVEETLALVCTPFGLNFAKISENEFEISQN